MDKALLILFIPIVVAIVSKMIWHHQITFKELGASLLATIFIGSIVVAAGYYRDTADFEIISGTVLAKEKDRVSCEHSYSCNCYTTCSGSGKTRSCSTRCQTCYEHWFDYDWVVHTNIGRINIDRVNRQGTEMPPRWDAVVIGEPFSRYGFYTNWVKGAPESLFHATNVLGFEKLIPQYPRVYDYYRIDRAITTGKIKVPDLKRWSQDISIMSRELGPKKQANLIVIFVDTHDRRYVEAFKSHWLGGKKNDVVLLIGAPEYPKIAWTEVVSWTDQQLFKIQLRDAVMDLGTVDRVKVLSAAKSTIMSSYVRKPASDFKYLEDTIEPPLWVMVTAFILSLITSIGMTILAHRSDMFGDNYRYKYR